MDMGDKDEFEPDKRNDNPMNYHPPNMSSDWRFNGVGLANTSMGLISMDNPVAIGKGDLIGSSSCSSASMVDSFGPTIWDHSTNSQNLGFCDINVQNNASTSDPMGMRKEGPASLRSSIDRPLNMGWNPQSSMLKGGIFLPNKPGIFPQSLSQFPADSAFIERAARFSCFSGGNFTDMVNPFGIPDNLSGYTRGGGMIQMPSQFFGGRGLQSVSGGQPQKNELNVSEASKIASMSEHGAAEESPLKNEIRSESLVRSHEEAKQGIGGSGNESDEAEFSGGGGQDSAMDCTGGDLTAKSFGLKKRKKNEQDMEHDHAKGSQNPGVAATDNAESQQKGAQNPTSTVNKATGKQGKQGSQASDPQKEEYIHVRARRGQATNSHSLAERVRREKISERMKFLQDLVPGCNKVTGKAVMLDEIINYVQSLQRQVEFLSMKLATVNPRLDFNIEGLLAKDILHSRAGPSSTLAFCPDMSMAYPPLHPSQAGLIPAALPGIGSSSDLLRRTINSQLTPTTSGFKEPVQLQNVWEDELHNVVQMSFGTNAPPEGLDPNGIKVSHTDLSPNIGQELSP